MERVRMHQRKEGIKTHVFSLMPPNQVRSQVVMSWEMCIVSTVSHDTPMIYQFRAIQSIANNNTL
jgi:hypothetical protein